MSDEDGEPDEASQRAEMIRAVLVFYLAQCIVAWYEAMVEAGGPGAQSSPGPWT